MRADDLPAASRHAKRKTLWAVAEILMNGPQVIGPWGALSASGNPITMSEARVPTALAPPSQRGERNGVCPAVFQSCATRKIAIGDRPFYASEKNIRRASRT